MVIMNKEEIEPLDLFASCALIEIIDIDGFVSSELPESRINCSDFIEVNRNLMIGCFGR